MQEVCMESIMVYNNAKSWVGGTFAPRALCPKVGPRCYHFSGDPNPILMPAGNKYSHIRHCESQYS